jgi:hypothetical protein
MAPVISSYRHASIASPTDLTDFHSITFHGPFLSMSLLATLTPVLKSPVVCISGKDLWLALVSISSFLVISLSVSADIGVPAITTKNKDYVFQPPLPIGWF